MDFTDYQALRLLVRQSTSSELVKRRELDRLDRHWKRGTLAMSPAVAGWQRWMHCEARFYLGDYSKWSGWEYRDKWAAETWFHNPYRVPVWNGEPGRVWVVGEQGIGDEVCFGQVLLGMDVVFETQARLVPIFERLGVKCVSAEIRDGKRLAREPEADYWVRLGELLRVRKPARRPYLNAIRTDEFRQYRGRTAIAWRGAQGSYPLEAFKAFGDLSVQYDQSWDEDCERPDLDLRDDLEGVLGLLANVDRLVTVSTTVAHLAAASGVETHLIVAPNNGARREQAILPWKWWSERTRRSEWYGDHVKTFLSLHDYRSWRKSAGSGLGRGDRPGRGDPDEGSVLAGSEGLRQAA